MKRRDRRSGYTLIEMVAVLVLMSSLITLATALLRRSIVGYSKTMDQAFQIQSKDRWSERLRNDIRQASDAIISDDSLTLNLSVSDSESVLYSKEADSTYRQRIVDGRKLAMERSPWASFARFVRVGSSTTPLIEAELESACFIQARLGVAANEPTQSREITK